MSEIPYTYSERTNKKYTIGNAVANAVALLKEKNIHEVCVNAIKQRDYATPLTLVELNKLQEQIVDDSLFYA